MIECLRGGVRPVLLLLIACVVWLSGCGLFGPRISDADLRILHPDEVATMVGDRGAVLLDVRSRAQFEEGHLPGAVHVPFAQLRADDDRLSGRPVIVYGADHESMLSAAGAKRLLDLGYRDVYDFRGGVAHWRETGRQVVGE